MHITDFRHIVAHVLDVTVHESICVRAAHMASPDHLSPWLVGFKQQP